MRTTFFIGDTNRPEGIPLRLFSAGSRSAASQLFESASEQCPLARQHVVDIDGHGPDAEAALVDAWEALADEHQARVEAVVGPLVGVLARIPGLCARGEALLAPDESAPDVNGQSRVLLTARVPDSWTVALETDPPVDADAWRLRLREALAWWDVSLLAPPQRHGGQPTARGWLDDELFASFYGLQRAIASDRAAALAWSPAEARLVAKVVRGRRGRLFLTQDSHDSHTQITAGRRLTATELDAWVAGTDARIADASTVGARYLQLIGPSPQAVHPEDLPSGQTLAGDRPVQQILDRLGRHERPTVMYPLAPFLAVRSMHDPFSNTDSHWNDLGAFLAYEAILDRLGSDVRCRRLTRRDVAFHETCYVGDLGSKLRPERASMFLRAQIHPRVARVVEDNVVRNHGRHAVFECEAAPPSTCVVFGDSWAYSLLLYLAESFRRIEFFHRVNVVDREPIQRERPHLVLSVLTERFCSALPNDGAAVPFERIVTKKTAQKDLVPAVAPVSRHEYLFSLALDRGLPRTGGFHLPG